MGMNASERYDLVVRGSEEIVTESELKDLIAKGGTPKAYVGFEPSGLVHLGWVLVASKVRDLAEAGFDTIVFWADWHAFINDKLGGNIGNIRACAAYMEDCFIALGVPEDKVRFVYATDILGDIEYWEKAINIAKATSLQRVKRAMTIMGRNEDEAEIDSSKMFYPILQACDIFHLDVDISYAGMDQRRANMLARDAADKLGWKKPIALHTPLLPGLSGGNRMDPASAKMSKSKPDSSVNIHDTPDEVRRKLSKAYCPPEKEEEDSNPVLMLCRHVIFPKLGKLGIDRPEKFGGPLSFDSYEELTDAYFSGSLHPLDLKKGVAEGIVEVLAPVAEYFAEKPENLNRMREILKSL